MKICCIFAGAKILDYSKIILPDDAYIVCADGGYSHLKFIDQKPNVILGDFDTLTEEIKEQCEVIRYSSEKDDTDTMLAVRLALERGFTHLQIYGATGGRLDHTLANIQTLSYIKEHHADAVIYGDTEPLCLIKNEAKSFAKREGYYFSILSFSDCSEGVTTRGTKYDLTNATLLSSYPLGVSNEILENFAAVEVKNGALLVLYSKK